jgi:hypothetical protein
MNASMLRNVCLVVGGILLVPPTQTRADDSAVFQSRSARSGPWSDHRTWENGRMPAAGDRVQVRSGHAVTYDVHSNAALRFVHVAGRLTFSREKSTLLDVGLLKIEPGETTTEAGFDCHAPVRELPAGTARPVLEIGTPTAPLPVGITATIRLRHHPGMDPQSLPAIVCCGGRWDIHGAPLRRTWLKLAMPAAVGDQRVTLEQPADDWRIGDRILITTDKSQGPGPNATFRQSGGRPKPVGTEERVITAIDGSTLSLDRPLTKSHHGHEGLRCEAANLSRNVVVESADSSGIRGHTMYHHDSSGGISYAEFRHLGKEGVLGRYAIHFHLVRDTMRGSGVLGASIWDSHNRWITIHGTDHLLIRDCVGYQSLGHGFFLEDATEQWNVLDRNLAVQAFVALPLPDQVLPFDPNDGAGFWWANGRNTLTRNVACENDRYGYHFQIAKTPDFVATLTLRQPNGSLARQDVRSIPFLRFEDNESHGEGLFDFRFGDEKPGSVYGDREHPFIVRNLRAWDSHYAVRPNIRYFQLEGLRVTNAAYGIYHPDYDMHVYRDVHLEQTSAEPLNGGHDEAALPYGDFTYDALTLTNCRLSRHPLIQLTANGAQPGLAGHFRGILLKGSHSTNGGIINFGGGPRTRRTDNPVDYFFHNIPTAGTVTRIASVRVLGASDGAALPGFDDWIGDAARGHTAADVTFPQLLAPRDDLPPATMITRVQPHGDRWQISGVTHDNGETEAVRVNGRPATIVERRAGVVDWTISLATPADGRIEAHAVDIAGNREQSPHRLTLRFENGST